MTEIRCGSKCIAVRQTCAMIGRPASLCRTLAMLDFMRVPRPAARTRISSVVGGSAIRVILSSGWQEFRACMNSRTCSPGTVNDDAGQTFRVVAHHLTPVQEVRAYDFSLQIESAEFCFVQADLVGAICAILFSLM